MHQVAIDNFINIFAIHIGVPRPLRVNNHDRPELAPIQTTCRVDPDTPLSGQTQLLDLCLGIFPNLAGIALLTACFAPSTLIGAKE